MVALLAAPRVAAAATYHYVDWMTADVAGGTASGLLQKSTIVGGWLATCVPKKIFAWRLRCVGGAGWRLPAPRDAAVCGLVAIDTAIVCRHAQRSADIGPEGQRPEAGGERRRRTAGGAAGRAAQIPRVVGCTEEVRFARRHPAELRRVRFPHHDQPGAFEAGHELRVVRGRVAGEEP